MRFSRSFVGFAAASLLAIACGGAAATETHAPDPARPAAAEAEQSADGRTGSHGMVLAGDPGGVVLSHIPMFNAPHDVQLLVRGSLAVGGKTLPKTFSDRTFTFVPEKTSLDALRLGVTRELRGTVFDGNFEQGGRPVATDARIAISGVVHQHILDADAPRADLGYLVLGSRTNVFAVHLIGAAPSFDEVLSVALGAGAPSDAELARGVMAHAAGKADTLAARLGRSPAGITLTAGTASFAVRPVATLSCLRGPEFAESCDGG